MSFKVISINNANTISPMIKLPCIFRCKYYVDESVEYWWAERKVEDAK
jgi:hypothetical protein